MQNLEEEASKNNLVIFTNMALQSLARFCKHFKLQTRFARFCNFKVPDCFAFRGFASNASNNNWVIQIWLCNLNV